MVSDLGPSPLIFFSSIVPTYTYRRDDGSKFDHFQRITDPALTVDPETGRPVERVITGGAGLQFKGTGFYLTDYVKKSGAPSSEDGSKAKNSGEGSSESKSTSSDAKPAAASSSPPASTPSKGSDTQSS